jgi:RimJ/RimL family protein N-acetyltransferase
MILRKAENKDAGDIIAILEGGRAFLAAQGLPQWQNGTGPNAEAVALDITRGEGYILTDGATLLGYAALVEGVDDYYGKIDGRWDETHSKYITVHRVAMAEAARGKRLAITLMGLLETKAMEMGYHDIRIDTHKGNVIMRHVIDLAGYTYAGEITLPFPHGERMAYQKLLGVRYDD